MKITFDTANNSNFDYHFESKEEYDMHPYSDAGYARWHRAPHNHKPYSGPCYRFYNEPNSFPCIMFVTREWDNPNGTFEIDSFIIQNPTIEE